MIQALGLVAAALTSLSYLPQIGKAWPRRSTDDLSFGTLLVLACGLAAWVAYGVAKEEAVIISANAVGLALILFLIGLKVRDALSL